MQKQQQNTTNKSRFADTVLVCLRLPGPTFGIDETHWRGTYAGKSRGTLLNYSCWPKAIHQNSCCTAATLRPCILYRCVSLFCFATCMTFTTNGAGEWIFSSGFMSTTITNRQGDVNEVLIYRFMMWPAYTFLNCTWAEVQFCMSFSILSYCIIHNCYEWKGGLRIKKYI